MYHGLLTLQCKYGSNDEGGKNGNGKEGSEISGGRKRMEVAWPFVSDDLVLFGESEEDLRAMVFFFFF